MYLLKHHMSKYAPIRWFLVNQLDKYFRVCRNALTDIRLSLLVENLWYLLLIQSQPKEQLKELLRLFQATSHDNARLIWTWTKFERCFWHAGSWALFRCELSARLVWRDSKQPAEAVWSDFIYQLCSQAWFSTRVDYSTLQKFGEHHATEEINTYSASKLQFSDSVSSRINFHDVVFRWGMFPVTDVKVDFRWRLNLIKWGVGRVLEITPTGAFDLKADLFLQKIVHYLLFVRLSPKTSAIS